MMRKLVLLLCLITYVSAQANGPDINTYLEMVANGKITEVKSQLPDLMVEYPDDAGVKLLLAVVIDDANKSLDIYKKLVANYPESDWADDAYWRIVQYYALKGETNKAQYELNYFRTKYPQSPYIVPAAEVVRMAEGIFRKENSILKATNEKPIGRENTPVIKNEPIYKPQPMQDLTTEQEPEKIGMVIEKEVPAKPVVEPVQEEEPQIQIKKVIATNQDNLAINTGNHKVVRQRVKVDIQDINPTPAVAPTEILEEHKKKISESETEIAEVRIEPVVEKLAVQPQTIEVEEVGNTGYYGLQVGLFDDMKNANSEMKKFLRKRMRTEVKEKSINNAQKFAVVIGNYSSLESANAAKIIVQQQCDCNPVVFEK